MIRRFEAADLEEVMQIWLEANIQAHDFIPQNYWMDHYAMVKDMLLSAELFVFQSDRSRTIDGFIGMSGGYIEGIFVREQEWSKGIGKRLLNHVKAAKGELSLSVYQKNEAAVRFYIREGFSVQAEKTDEDTGEAELSMVWKRGNL